MIGEELHRSVLEGRFIKKVLAEQAGEIDRAQKNQMSKGRFENVNRLPRRFEPSNEMLRMKISTIHRFVDMKKRRLAGGNQIKKKHYPIYNKIIFGHLNNIVKELSFGFTEATVEEMRKLES